jgi:hypothetical protein
MPSQRRQRTYGVFFFLGIIFFFYITRGPGQTRNSQFFTKTQEALQQKEYVEAAQVRDAEGVSARLKVAEEEAKKKTADKSDRYMESVEGGAVGKGVAGRVKFSQQDGDEKKVQGVAAVGGKPRDRDAAKVRDETPEDHEVEVELNAILKKSPSTSFLAPTELSRYTNITSYYILKDLLPLFQESQIHPSRQVQNITSPLRRRTGRASTRPKVAKRPSRHYGS